MAIDPPGVCPIKRAFEEAAAQWLRLAEQMQWMDSQKASPASPGLGRGFRCRIMGLLQHSGFFVRIKGWRPNFSPGGENTHLCYTTPKTQAPPSERGFFFAARATRHPPASLLRARLRFATGQRDSFSKLVAVIPNVFRPNYCARRLKNESDCDSCDNHLIGSACPRSGRPR
jgi:hypothetical protein